MTETCPVCGVTLNPDASACPTCGFKLLGATQSFKPFPIEGRDVPATDHPQHQFVLRVVKGPQIGMVYRLGNAPMSVGRNPQCDIFLNDMTVSRSHAVVEPTGDGYTITDDSSFNGVWVNNDNVEARELHEGDVVQIGAFCLVYREE